MACQKPKLAYKHMKPIEIKTLITHEDERGVLVELFKFPQCGQINLITTRPGFVRGNHYHTRKRELFCVIDGAVQLDLKNRADNKKETYLLSSDVFQAVEVLPGWIHNIQAVGGKTAKVLIWNNEIFDPNDADTYPEQI